MSGLIKHLVCILGILLIVAGQSHAQSVPIQTNSEEASQANSQQNMQEVQNISNGNETHIDSTSKALGGESNVSDTNAIRPGSINSETNNPDNSIANQVDQNTDSQNEPILINNEAQGSDTQALPPANSQTTTAEAEAEAENEDDQSVQPLPPINSSESDNHSDIDIAPSDNKEILGVDQSMLPHDLSPYGMFMQADRVVKSVMIGLALASFLTWVIFIAKTIELSIAKKKLRKAVRDLVSAQSLNEAIEKFSNKKNVSGMLVNAAASEVRMSINAVDGAGSSGLKERISSALSRIEAHAGRRMAGGSAVLATIGSISPFVGLFGTVWGIMNAFIGISRSQVTNLAVVAPGIAEALLATAIGLVAAIPAVVIYNYLAKSITGYRQIVIDASTSIERLVSRDLDFREAQKKASIPVQSLATE